MATASDPGPRAERWRIVPLDPPAVVRRCARCDALRRFRSSGRFRVNAQKRRLDVWLVHRCEACDATWNAAVLERVPARDVPAAALEAFHRNDPDTAWRHAFAVPGAALSDGDAWRVERTCDAAGPGSTGGLLLRIELAAPVAVRLDRVLARGLGASRTWLARAEARGAVRVEPGPPAGLRASAHAGLRVPARGGLRAFARDGQRVWLAGGEPGDDAGPLC